MITIIKIFLHLKLENNSSGKRNGISNKESESFHSHNVRNEKKNNNKNWSDQLIKNSFAT